MKIVFNPSKLKESLITSPYGAQESFRTKPHTGIDIRLEEGTPLAAVKDGIIKLADYGDQNAGKTVLLEMNDGKTAVYGHLSDFAVKEGQRVTEGQIIGYSGNTGFSTGEHLHFAIKDNGAFIDPAPYVDAVDQVQQTGLMQWFLERGAVDQYGGFTFADFFRDHAATLGIETVIVLGILLILLFNRYTKPYTLGALGIFLLSVLV